MASRPATRARPGAKFAQFKLVLLGKCSLRITGKSVDWWLTYIGFFL
jgi:hypothetical protein